MLEKPPKWTEDEWATIALHLASPMAAFFPHPSRIKAALKGLGEQVDHRAAYETYLDFRPREWPALPDYESVLRFKDE